MGDRRRGFITDLRLDIVGLGTCHANTTTWTPYRDNNILFNEGFHISSQKTFHREKMVDVCSTMDVTKGAWNNIRQEEEEEEARKKKKNACKATTHHANTKRRYQGERKNR